MQLIYETFRYDVLINETIKREKLLLKQNYIFYRNLKFIKTSPSITSVLQGSQVYTSISP